MDDKIYKLAEEICPELDTDSYCDVFKRAMIKVKLYANNNLLSVIDEPYLLLLQANLLIHYFITDPDSGENWYGKYKIGSQDFLVTSVSSAGASTSINSVKVLDDGDFFTLDLYRTPYGRQAYQILSSLKGIIKL